MELRKHFVLRWVEVPPLEVKKGDIFRQEPISEKDTDCDPLPSLALSDAVPEGTEGNTGIAIEEDNVVSVKLSGNNIVAVME